MDTTVRVDALVPHIGADFSQIQRLGCNDPVKPVRQPVFGAVEEDHDRREDRPRRHVLNDLLLYPPQAGISSPEKLPATSTQGERRH
jgi:hypothetical protein